ncbi:MAG: hypothetical protein IKN67_02885 [Alphaproteobacteria bacterium]|nr:hypothetical protein [Alphaproteobacteria bacterium]
MDKSVFWLPLPHEMVADRKPKAELLSLLENGAFLLPEDEPLLFRKAYETQLYAFLQHHSLAEKNHGKLFAKGNEKKLAFFIERWTLATRYEAKLTKPEYRDLWLEKYINFHRFANADNEFLLFGYGMEKYRRLYISKYCFYNRDAEKMLFEPEYTEELKLYIRQHTLFNDNETLFYQTAEPELVDAYKKVHNKE